MLSEGRPAFEVCPAFQRSLSCKCSLRFCSKREISVYAKTSESCLKIASAGRSNCWYILIILPFTRYSIIEDSVNMVAWMIGFSVKRNSIMTLKSRYGVKTFASILVNITTQKRETDGKPSVFLDKGTVKWCEFVDKNAENVVYF